MIIAHYAHRLPANYDIGIIRDRAKARGGMWDAVPELYFKGFLALQTHRVAHWTWNEGREALALYLQSRVSELFQLDIHPAAAIGPGFPVSTQAHVR